MRPLQVVLRLAVAVVAVLGALLFAAGHHDYEGPTMLAVTSRHGLSFWDVPVLAAGVIVAGVALVPLLRRGARRGRW